MSDGIRVLQVTAIPVTALRFVVPLARALEAAGYRVELATGPGRGLAELEAEGLRVHRLPITRSLLGWRNLHALGGLRTIARAGAFDIVHAHTPSAGAIARLATRRLAAKAVYTLHGSLWDDVVPRWRRWLFSGLERSLAGATRMIFTVNEEDAADLIQRARVPGARVRVLPAGGVGVDPEFFVADAELDRLRESARERLGISMGQSVLAYVGRTVGAKGMVELARAFERLAWDEPRARLLVIGDALEGDRDPYSRERFLAECGEAAERVVWPGFQERVAPTLAAADALILPSRREGFGMGLAEASAMGLPVVATETRGARAAVRPDETGLLVPVGDVEGLARAALQVLTDRELASSLGAAGRRLARERFAREAVLAAYLEGYRGLSGESG